MPFEVISRADARAKGLKRFFSGESCNHGHIAERYAKGGSCVECARLAYLEWYSDPKNSAHVVEYIGRRRRENPKLFKERYDQWLSDTDNYQRKLTHNRNRRARLLAAGEHTPEESARLLERQHHRCANLYCLADLRENDKQLDHIISLARGGSNRIENLQWLCEPCNRRKCALDPDVWFDREAERAQQGNDA